jgi:hypothetical protein
VLAFDPPEDFELPDGSEDFLLSDFVSDLVSDFDSDFDSDFESDFESLFFPPLE